MRIGAVFPQLEIGADPAVVRDWTLTVEEAGYTHALAYDHVLGADPTNRPGWTGYTDKSLFHEVFVLFGYMAAITTSLELVTGVLILPQRQTALVAKQAAEIDVLSGGRLRLGVGIGWNQVEYDALGVPFTQRGARLTEQVELLRKLWAEPVLNHDGKYDRVEEAGLNPLPGRKIPIWFGGGADAVVQDRSDRGWLDAAGCSGRRDARADPGHPGRRGGGRPGSGRDRYRGPPVAERRTAAGLACVRRRVA
jgi:probable F420-dependent oxidoreductase